MSECQLAPIAEVSPAAETLPAAAALPEAAASPLAEASPLASQPRLPTLASASAPMLQGVQRSMPVAAAPVSWQARVDHLMVRSVPELRYRVMRLGLPGIAGLVSFAVAAILVMVLLIPAHRSIESLSTQLSQAAVPAPLPAASTLSPHQFAGSLPSRGQIPALLGTVLAQANEAGVVLEQGKYTFTPAAADHLARYSFEFPVKANYASVRTFINKSLTAIPALGLDKLQIARKNVGDTTVSAEVGFVIYLKGA
ncbi:MAG: hypothetical protein M3O26_03555 [Pseudomonadota bacterium]|nr:hypothetical protein [Pseudomonadota bacterium]